MGGVRRQSERQDTGRLSSSINLRESVVEIVLKVGPPFDYRPCSFLQLVLYSFQEWNARLHMQVLSQSNCFSHFT